MAEKLFRDADDLDALHNSAVATGTPGKSTLTSRMSSGRPSQVIFRVESAEAAQVFADRFGPRDDKGVAADADEHVDRAAGSSGAPLPGELRDRFESSLGADLSSVRLHTGSESATAAGAVGARAYTVGNDIHFGAGHYDPSGSDGMFLIAHEVAHTVQQAGSAPVRQNKLEVSTPGDSLEHEADRAAESMIAGRTAAVGRGPAGIGRKIQRDPNTEHIGGDAKDGDVLYDSTIQGRERAVKPGEATFSDAMLQENAECEGMFAELAAGDLLPNLTCDTSGVQKQIDWQAKICGIFKQEQEGNPHLARSGRQEREEGRLGMLYAQREEVAAKFAAYNGWKSFPNQALMAVQGVKHMQQNLGVSDENAMLDKIKEGVEKAKTVIALAREQRAKNPNANMKELNDLEDAIPADMENDAKDADSALGDMNTSYNGYRSVMLDLEKGAEEKKGEADEKRKEEIQGIKQAIQTAASAIDSGYSILSTAPGKLNEFTTKAAELKDNATKKRDYVKNVARINSGHGDKVKKTNNVVDFDEAWNEEVGKTPDVPTMKPEDQYDIPNVPESAGGIIAAGAGFAADLYFEKELRQININLNTIAAKGSQLRSLGVQFDQAGKLQAFKDGLAKFSAAMAKLKQKTEEAKKKYNDFGERLDRISQQLKTQLPAGHAPGAGQEMFATIFTVAGQLKQVAMYSNRAGGSAGRTGTGAASAGAGAGLDQFSGSEIRSWMRKLGAARKGESFQSELKLTGGETSSIGKMAGACDSWAKSQESIEVYGEASAQVDKLLADLRKA